MALAKNNNHSMFLKNGKNIKEKTGFLNEKEKTEDSHEPLPVKKVIKKNTLPEKTPIKNKIKPVAHKKKNEEKIKITDNSFEDKIVDNDLDMEVTIPLIDSIEKKKNVSKKKNISEKKNEALQIDDDEVDYDIVNSAFENEYSIKEQNIDLTNIDNINDLSMFSDDVQAMIRLAVSVGYIHKATLARIEHIVTTELFDYLISYLNEAEINIIKSEDDEKETDTEEEETDSDTHSEQHEDLTGMSALNLYLKDMSSFLLLSKDEEIELSKKIKSSKDDVIHTISVFNILKKLFVEFKKNAVEGAISLRSFVDTYALNEEEDENLTYPLEEKGKTSEETLNSVIEDINSIEESFSEQEVLYESYKKKEITLSQYKIRVAKIEKKTYNVFRKLRISNLFINIIVHKLKEIYQQLNLLKENNYNVMKENFNDEKKEVKKRFKSIEEFENFIKMPVEIFENKIEFLIKVHDENAKAHQKMILANVRLVFSIAKRYQNRGISMEDLAQDGNFGLIKAVDRFSYQKGCKFSTYASCWIKQSALRAIAEKRSDMRRPVHVLETINKITKAYKELQNKLGRKPTKLEVSEAYNISIDKINKCNIWNRKVSHMSDLLALSVDNDKSSADDRVEDKTITSQEYLFNEQVLKLDLVCVFAELGPREERVNRLRYIAEQFCLPFSINKVLGKKSIEKFKEESEGYFQKLMSQRGENIIFDNTEEKILEIRRIGNTQKKILFALFLHTYFYPPKKTLEEVGKIFDITRERARQIEETGRKNISEIKGYSLAMHLNLQNPATAAMG